MKSEWKQVTVGDICSSVSETHKGNDTQVITINTSDVFGGYILNNKKIENKNLPGQFKKTFRTEDILYSEIRPANHRYAFVRQGNTELYIASTKLMVIRADKSKVSPDFLYFFLTAPHILQELQQLAEARSGTFPQITFDAEVATLPFSLPPLPTQRKIAAILSALDDKIETNNAICRNLEKIAASILNDYITNTSQEAILGDIVTFVNGFPFKSSSYTQKGLYRVITIKNVLDGRIDITGAEYINNLPQGIKDSCILAPGDILLSLTGNVGRVGITTHENLLLNQRVAKIVPNDEKLKAYIYFLFRRRQMKEQMERLARGTAQANLSTVETLNISIHYCGDTITQIENELSLLLQQIIITEQENSRLSSLRDTLLPRLMSGEPDISTLNL